MVQALPEDIVCHARVLQRIEMVMCRVIFQVSSNSTVEQDMAVEFHAYWIDSIGVYYFTWNWSKDLPKDVVKLLNEHRMLFTLPTQRTEPIDNLSEAGRRAVLMIDSMLHTLDQVAIETFKENKIKYTPSHKWEERVRNSIT